jgi:hypothetical protein
MPLWLRSIPCARRRSCRRFWQSQIIATGHCGLQFLRQSHRHMTKNYIDVYGSYAVKLLRLQNELIQTFDRYQRGNKQTVEVPACPHTLGRPRSSRDHQSARRSRGGWSKLKHDPMRQADIERRLSNLAKACRCGAKTRAGHPCRQAAVRERGRCRMHGGAKGSGGPRGNRNGRFRHGRYTRENESLRRVMRAKIRED